MIKKLGVSVVSVAILLFTLSFQSYAATCLDVRDYGYHKYDNRYLYTNERRADLWFDEYYVVVNRIDSINYDQQRVRTYHYENFAIKTGICICGLSYDFGYVVIGSGTRDEYYEIVKVREGRIVG